jgi:hypothetical protein
MTYWVFDMDYQEVFNFNTREELNIFLEDYEDVEGLFIIRGDEVEL